MPRPRWGREGTGEGDHTVQLGEFTASNFTSVDNFFAQRGLEVLASILASGSHFDLSRAPYVLYGVEYIELVSRYGIGAGVILTSIPIPVFLD